MMKRIIALVSVVFLLVQGNCVYALEKDVKEFTYLPIADSYVSMGAPNMNFGDLSIAKIATYSTSARDIPYFSFDFSAERNDDFKKNEIWNEDNGMWLSFDVTKIVKEKYKGDKTLNTAVWIPWFANTDYSGNFSTKDAGENLPHLNIKTKGNEVVEAKIFLFGGALTRNIEMYETAGAFDELSITYKKRPQLEELIGKARIEYEMSKEPVEEGVVKTYEGLDISELSKKGMAKFHTLYPDLPKWDDIYDTKLVPSVEKLEEDYNKNLPDKSHPRTLGTAESWENVRSLIEQENEVVLKWKEQILKSADIAMKRGTPVYAIKTVGGGIYDTGFDIQNLALAYQITGDKKYSDACYEYMVAIANYPDWNEGYNSMLNLGACSLNVGIGYDLIYDTMSTEQKNKIIQGATKNGFDIMLGAPNTGTNNWNAVINGGISVLACAMLDEVPDTAFEIIRQSVANIPISLAQYYPDGAFPEGPSYWAYTTDNLVNFMAAMNYTFGTDYGIGEFEGVEGTCYYPVYLQGPTRSIRFRYGDDRTANINSKGLFYLSARYNNPVFARFQMEYAIDMGTYSSIAPYWYSEKEMYEENDISVYENLPKDRVFEGESSVGFMRSNWEDENALFTGFKAGFPQTSHADMDIGTFSFAANGVEWAGEVKAFGDYIRPGYFSLFRQTRYLYYERGVQGHNTLLFNPGRTYPNIEFGQETESNAIIEKYDFSEGKAPYAIINMSDTYRRYATSVRRGISLINNRREFLIQDEIQSSGNNTVHWFMHTKAEIETKGSEAILTVGDKKLYCKILSPANASFEVMEAKPLPMTATVGGFDLKNYLEDKKLSIKCNYEDEETISVWMVPLVYGDEIPANLPQVEKLDSWPREEKENVKINGIKINGKDLLGFAPDKYVYDLEHDDISSYEVLADENVVVNTEYTDNYLRIECFDKTSKLSPSRYLVSIQEKPTALPYKFEASEVNDPMNKPEMTLDGDFETRYACEGKQWIKYDLEEIKTMDHLMLAFYMGNTRKYNISIELSEDDENYVKVFEGTTSGTTSKYESYIFEKQKARYVRINFNGNNENAWSNLSEISFGFTEDILSEYIEQEQIKGEE